MNEAMKKFSELYGCEPQYIIHAPGRTELGGNHTDHQHGRVLAAPVDLVATAYVNRNDSGVIRVASEGHDSFKLDLSDTSIHKEEYGTTLSLVRGVASAFMEYGLNGFDAYITSDIPAGSGMSSSAAIEILLGRICCRLTGVQKTGEELAILGQYVENTYFGKPCGLMDQMACAAAGILAIDFENPKAPVSREIHVDFRSEGYSLCIIKCGAGHENLTANYADITRELAQLCGMFGESVLREVSEEDFYARIDEVRKTCGDRAVMRAIHVFEDNRRVLAQVKALEDHDMDTYLKLVDESGHSSWELLQNVVPEGETFHQDMAFALAMARRYLKGRGACRVHGGGFAGTVQAYVPNEMTEEFRQGMEAALGEGCCIFVNVGTI